jgi:hypothetical protein
LIQRVPVRDQVFSMVDQQAQLPDPPVELCRGQVGVPQRGPADRKERSVGSDIP